MAALKEVACRQNMTKATQTHDAVSPPHAPDAGGR